MQLSRFEIEFRLKQRIIRAYISTYLLIVFLAVQINTIQQEKQVERLLAMREPVICQLSHTIKNETEDENDISDIFSQAIYTHGKQEYLVTLLLQQPPQEITVYISKTDPEDFMYREESTSAKYRIWILAGIIVGLLANASIIQITYMTIDKINNFE